MKNRFMLAPLTNLRSHTDGRLPDDEYSWLTMRAPGQFGMTMTCAAQSLRWLAREPIAHRAGHHRRRP